MNSVRIVAGAIENIPFGPAIAWGSGGADAILATEFAPVSSASSPGSGPRIAPVTGSTNTIVPANRRLIAWIVDGALAATISTLGDGETFFCW
jgi:hypothetical protein